MKIIIADDEFANRLLVAEIVRNLGHELIEAENGEEAYKTVQRTGDIDLILMDIEMPIMNGIDAAKMIRENLGHPRNKIPIIAMTGYDRDEITECSDGHQFDSFLMKPYTVDTLTKLLRSFCKK